MTTDRLRSRRSGWWLFKTTFFSEPPVNQLVSDEWIHHFYWNADDSVVINETQSQTTKGEYASAVLFTDRRLIVLLGKSGGDTTISLPYDRIDRFSFTPTNSLLRIVCGDDSYQIELTGERDSDDPLSERELEILTEFLSFHTDIDVPIADRWQPLARRRRHVRECLPNVRGTKVTFEMLSEAMQYTDPGEIPRFTLHTWYVSTEALERHKANEKVDMIHDTVMCNSREFSETTLITDKRLLIDCRERTLSFEGYKKSDSNFAHAHPTDRELACTDTVQTNIPFSLLNNPARISRDGERIEIHPSQREPIYLSTHQTDIADAAIQFIRSQL